MKQFLILLLFISCFSVTFAQDKPAYKIFDAEGKEVKYEKMISAAEKADVIFFGEQHNDPISHWLELQVFKSIFEKDKTVALALEMFEADDQVVLNEYINGVIEEKHLLSEAKIWPNYKTDYKPLVEFAKANKLKVIASNIPRRYANLVYRKGINALDSLPESRQWIAPLPITIDLELPGYKSMMSSMGSHGTPGSAENMARSQAVKDATMAFFILKNRKGKVYHVNGAYHSQNGEGIIWYLKKSEPGIKTATIHVIDQEQLASLNAENKKLADFIIVVPSDMTKTY
jgi:uncharacterized iron-regulated protein